MRSYSYNGCDNLSLPKFGKLFYICVGKDGRYEKNKDDSIEFIYV